MHKQSSKNQQKTSSLIIGFVLDDTLDIHDGVQAAILTLGAYMKSMGHEVHYIVPQTTRSDIENIHSYGSYYSLHFNGNSVRTPRWLDSTKIHELFATVKFDVLHIQMPYSPLFAARIIKLAPDRVRVIGTFHILPYGVLSNLGTRIIGYTLYRSLNRFDAIFAVSKPAQQFMLKTFRVNSKVLPNPINYSYFSSFKRRPSTKTRIAFVGRFDERKGVMQLIQAYEMLPLSVRAHCSIIMCGKGPLHDEATRYCIANKLDIKFPGFVTEKEKAQILADSDIAIFPSISGEGFGIVLVESMSAGARVTLGGNNPGYASVLSEWPETLFDGSDPKSIFQALQIFIDNENLRSKIGNAQHQAAHQYADYIVGGELLESYKNKRAKKS